MTDITTFLDRIAKRQSSFVLAGNRVYDILQYKKEGNYLEIEGIRFSLVSSLTYSELEKLDENLQRNLIEKDCADYVKSAINKELKSQQEVDREQRRLATLKFITDEFLPYFLSKKYETDTYVGIEDLVGLELDPIGKARKEITDKLKSDFPVPDVVEQDDPVLQLRNTVIQKEKSTLKTSSILPELVVYDTPAKTIFDSSYLGNIVGHQPIYIIDGEAFQLESAKDKKDRKVIFQIDGECYIPSYDNRIKLRDISTELLQRNLKKWHINALERNQDAFEAIRKSITKNEITESLLHELAKLQEYDLGNCGFIMHDKEYYVYSRVPKFATQDGRNPELFWPYESTRIAIKIGWKDNSAYSTGRPKCADKRITHPCLSDRYDDQRFYEICNLARDDSDYENNPPEMVRKLSDGVNVILSPLSKESLDNHSGHTYFGDHLNDILKQKPLKREEAVSLGYLIIEVMSQTNVIEDISQTEAIEDSGE